MPGYDGTGPQGRGPVTGRGLGFCATGQPRRFYGIGFGRGGGFGRGRGRGWRHMYYATGLPGWTGHDTPTKEEEAEYLKQEADSLEQELKAVRQRISELGD